MLGTIELLGTGKDLKYTIRTLCTKFLDVSDGTVFLQFCKLIQLLASLCFYLFQHAGVSNDKVVR